MCSESNFLNTDWYFFPLRGPEGAVALLAMANHENANTERFFLSPAQKQMLYSYCDQAALAIERAQLSQDIEESRILSETEKLRSALLSSISHDLRTPLVSIIGSATSLQGLEHSLSPGAKGELLKNILDEAERLNRFIQNLLDMTRLGHGSLEPKRDWIEFRDILGRALKRLHKELAMHQVEIGAISELSTLYVDPVLMEQVLANILENASKYAPAGTKIKITFVKEGNNGVIRISDEGSGIPERDRDLVFDMFYRVKSTDMKAAGTGLGLAICRGLMEAHKGKIWAQTGISGQGTTIVISLPLSAVGGALSHIEESHE